MPRWLPAPDSAAPPRASPSSLRALSLPTPTPSGRLPPDCGVLTDHRVDDRAAVRRIKTASRRFACAINSSMANRPVVSMMMTTSYSDRCATSSESRATVTGSPTLLFGCGAHDGTPGAFRDDLQLVHLCWAAGGRLPPAPGCAPGSRGCWPALPGVVFTGAPQTEEHDHGRRFFASRRSVSAAEDR